VCTPANIFTIVGNNEAFVYIFNGSSSTANVTTHFLNTFGSNLAGAPNSGASFPFDHYPGQVGNTTVPVLPQNTMIIAYQTTSESDLSIQVITVTVNSDQPVAVSINPGFDGPHPMPCTLLPK